jgi:hypothetical protein
MGCPVCTRPLNTDVIDRSGSRLAYCVGCDAPWSAHAVTASTRGPEAGEATDMSPMTAALRAALADRYEWKLGRRSFTQAYRYQIRPAAERALVPED